VTCPYAVHIGVFLLGADDTERDRFEQHLLSCHSCQAELDELAGLPAMLAAAKAAGDPMTSSPLIGSSVNGSSVNGSSVNGSSVNGSSVNGSSVNGSSVNGGPITGGPVVGGPTTDRLTADLVDRVLTTIATERTTRDRHRRIALLAAVALILAGSLGGILYVLDDRQQPTPTAVPVPVAGANSSFGVSAMTSVHPQPGGTRIDMTLSGLTQDTSCRLVVRATDGRTETAASWRVTYQDTVQVAGMTSISAAQLAELAVIDDDGRQLITIAMAPPEGKTQ
jgi:hypothetical protein